MITKEMIQIHAAAQAFKAMGCFGMAEVLNGWLV